MKLPPLFSLHLMAWVTGAFLGVQVTCAYESLQGPSELIFCNQDKGLPG